MWGTGKTFWHEHFRSKVDRYSKSFPQALQTGRRLFITLIDSICKTENTVSIKDSHP